MGGKVAEPQAPLCLGIFVGSAVFTAVFFDNSFTTVTLFYYRLKRTIRIFCAFTGLHNANLLKKYHFFLESEKKLPYNTVNYVLTNFVYWEKLDFIKGFLPTVNKISG